MLCGRPHQQYSTTTFMMIDNHHLLQNKPIHIYESSLVPSFVSSHSFPYSQKISAIIEFVGVIKKNVGNIGGNDNGEAEASLTTTTIYGANAVPIGK